MRGNNNQQAFFALLRAGLWEKDVQILPYNVIDFTEVQRLAEEQSAVGLIAAGLEHVTDVKVPKKDVLQFIGQMLHLEQRNEAMNNFIGVLVDKMQEEGIFTLLVKGQGVAQCYERPLWRASGDIDFYLSKENFKKAKEFFRPLVQSFDPDNDHSQHINMHYDPWVVEIHGNQYCSLSVRVNAVMDEIHRSLFYKGSVRSVKIGDSIISLPSPNEDALLIFVHYLNHFYKGGLGVRQICDWCRLLWTYRAEIDYALLENRLKRMGLFSVWKAFAYFSVHYLGMPEETMPFYSSLKKWKRKADRICSFVIEVGNFGHNKDTSYYSKYQKLVRKVISMGRRLSDVFNHSRIFPMETLRFFPCIVYYGIKAVLRGE